MTEKGELYLGNPNNPLDRGSNYGSPVDFAAPGTNIYPTLQDNKYGWNTGTSMAAPHVAGLLISGGVEGKGTILKDKDNDPDPIAHRK